jgi:hypothetical protein
VLTALTDTRARAAHVGFVLTASTDARVRLWTHDGERVGTFGTGLWSLTDRASWADPNGSRLGPVVEKNFQERGQRKSGRPRLSVC